VRIYYKNGCPACELHHLLFQKLEREFHIPVQLQNTDIVDTSELDMYNITHVPTIIIVFDDGYESYTGDITFESLKEHVSNHSTNSNSVIVPAGILDRSATQDTPSSASMHGEKYRDDSPERQRMLIFYMINCPACEQAKPIFEQISQNVPVTYVDVLRTEDEELVNKYNIQRVPTIIIAKNDGESVPYHGERTVDDIMQFWETLTQNQSVNNSQKIQDTSNHVEQSINENGDGDDGDDGIVPKEDENCTGGKCTFKPVKHRGQNESRSRHSETMQHLAQQLIENLHAGKAPHLDSTTPLSGSLHCMDKTMLLSKAQSWEIPILCLSTSKETPFSRVWHRLSLEPSKCCWVCTHDTKHSVVLFYTDFRQKEVVDVDEFERLCREGELHIEVKLRNIQIEALQKLEV
jgi:thiol-disulfide isomerase/thioredoxin